MELKKRLEQIAAASVKVLLDAVEKDELSEQQAIDFYESDQDRMIEEMNDLVKESEWCDDEDEDWDDDDLDYLDDDDDDEEAW